MLFEFRKGGVFKLLAEIRHSQDPKLQNCKIPPEFLPLVLPNGPEDDLVF